MSTSSPFGSAGRGRSRHDASRYDGAPYDSALDDPSRYDTARYDTAPAGRAISANGVSEEEGPGGARLTYRSFGRAGAERTVALVRVGAAALDDPSPRHTMRRGVRVLAVCLETLGIGSAQGFGGRPPVEEHALALATLLHDQGARDESPMPIVAMGEATERAVRAAATLGDALDTLVLVAPRMGGRPYERDALGDVLAELRGRVHVVDRPGALLPAERGDIASGAWFATEAEATYDELEGRGPLSLGSVWDDILKEIMR